MKILLSVTVYFAVIIFFIACSKDEAVVQSSDQIVQKYLNIDLNNLPKYGTISYPNYYTPNILGQLNTPPTNQINDKTATLGRVLFYDKQLSLNNTVSCASCHQQANGFTDKKVLSEGFKGGLTGKHSMRLGNISFYADGRMFWDKRANSVEAQSTLPIQDATEMGFSVSAGGIDSLLRKMRKIDYYPVLFKNAFGNEEINETKMQLALAQFLRSMVSINSKFDEGFAKVFSPLLPAGGVGNNFPNFTAQENLGKSLFLAPPNAGGAGCGVCHSAPVFGLAANSLNNGLDANETVIFKSPSLKNIALAPPYMHDGRFSSLEQVIEHYNSGIKSGRTLDPRLSVPAPPNQNNPAPLRLNLSQNDKAALLAFLNTLTDNVLTTDTKFSNPFK